MYTSVCAQNDALFSVGSCFLYIQRCSDELAYDFTLYDHRMNPLDGGAADFDGDPEESCDPFRLAARMLAEYFELSGVIEELRLTDNIPDRLSRKQYRFA